MKPGCPRSEASAGTLVENSWAIVLLSSLLCELPGLSRDQTGRAGLTTRQPVPCAQPLHGMSVSAGDRAPRPAHEDPLSSSTWHFWPAP